MFVDEILLATRDSECDYFNNGEHTLDMPLGYARMRPFGIFLGLGIERIKLGKITLFCGSSNSVRDYLLEVVAQILGAENPYYKDDKSLLCDYAKRCRVIRRTRSPFKCVYISKQLMMDEVRNHCISDDFRQSRSMAEIYDDKIEPKALYVIEMPEAGMSVEECASVASLIYDAANYSKAQFIISTSSPIFMGIKGAEIYDLDQRPFLPKTYYYSEARKEFSKTYDEICELHSRKNK